MQKKMMLSLKPLQDTRWEKHEPTGVEFQIAPLPATLDDELSRKHSDIYGNVQSMAFAHEVEPHIIKGWRGVGENGVEIPVNHENLKRFVETHGITIMPWVLRRSRSLDFYREQETAAAKND